MSASQQTVFERPADYRKRSVYGFVLPLVCIALAFVVANAKFAPTLTPAAVPLMGQFP
jgi:hypothetical protein